MRKGRRLITKSRAQFSFRSLVTRCVRSGHSLRTIRSGPGAFPVAPNRDVIKPERIPPQIKHRLIKTEDSFSADTCGRRSELTQPVVDGHSLSFIDTREQVPQRERVALAGLRKDYH